MMNDAKQAKQFARLRSGIAAAATQFTVCVAGVFALWLTGSAVLNVISEIRFDPHRFAEGPVPRSTTPLCLPGQRFITVPLRSVDNGH
jgi:hypothetical protein